MAFWNIAPYRITNGDLVYLQAGVAVGDSAINMNPARKQAAEKGRIVLEFHTHPGLAEAGCVRATRTSSTPERFRIPCSS
ncbi:hypothetical protein [Nonomuraea sp. NPDC046570]|uniref:hypothetical protein n=1 Tax=Nonomuraea sp. NPDC046570 TaxID=3155255 RepID=UPI0033FF383C